jgi:hypothetical protein
MRYSTLFATGIVVLLIGVSSIFLIPSELSSSKGGLFNSSTTDTSLTSQSTQTRDINSTAIHSLTTSWTTSSTVTTTLEAPRPDPRIVKANGYLLASTNIMMQWTDSKISSLVKNLIAANVTYVYLNLANMNQNGSVYENFTLDTILILRFDHFAGSHAFQFIAWTGTQADPNTLLQDFTYAGIAETVASAYKAGFDGFLIDIEPVPNDSPQFIAMLEDFRTAIDKFAPGMLLGVNNMNVLYSATPGRLWAWDSLYLQNITKIVDYISPMLFESGQTDQSGYVQYVERQMEIISQYSMVPVMYEIPDWYDPSTYHFPLGENISNAIIAFQQYANLSNEGQRPSPSNMLGLAIYGLNKSYTFQPETVMQALETTPYDWSFFVTQWVNTAYPEEVGSGIG